LGDGEAPSGKAWAADTMDPVKRLMAQARHARNPDRMLTIGKDD